MNIYEITNRIKTKMAIDQQCLMLAEAIEIMAIIKHAETLESAQDLAGAFCRAWTDIIQVVTNSS